MIFIKYYHDSSLDIFFMFIFIDYNRLQLFIKAIKAVVEFQAGCELGVILTRYGCCQPRGFPPPLGHLGHRRPLPPPLTDPRSGLTLSPTRTPWCHPPPPVPFPPIPHPRGVPADEPVPRGPHHLHGRRPHGRGAGAKARTPPHILHQNTTTPIP